MTEITIIYFIMLCSAIIVTGVICSNNILKLTLLNSAFSLFTVMLYLVLDAPDVAMTEASISILSVVFTVFAIRKIYQTNYNFIDKFRPFYFCLCIALAAALIYAATYLPNFGAPHFNRYYLLNSENDTGAVSVVTAILASYRGYDTMLETLVILVGALSILLVSDKNTAIADKPDQLIKIMTRLLLPIILIFALYIEFHGEVSPGGGFQAGAIIATIFAAYAMAYGENSLRKFADERRLSIVAIAGLGLYLAVGLISMFSGANFLNYELYFSHSLWIMLVELAIATAVACSMLIIYLRLS